MRMCKDSELSTVISEMNVVAREARINARTNDFTESKGRCFLKRKWLISTITTKINGRKMSTALAVMKSLVTLLRVFLYLEIENKLQNTKN